MPMMVAGSQSGEREHVSADNGGATVDVRCLTFLNANTPRAIR